MIDRRQAVARGTQRIRYDISAEMPARRVGAEDQRVNCVDATFVLHNAKTA